MANYSEIYFRKTNISAQIMIRTTKFGLGPNVTILASSVLKCSSKDIVGIGNTCRIFSSRSFLNAEKITILYSNCKVIV